MLPVVHVAAGPVDTISLPWSPTLECVVLYIYCTLQTTHTLECVVLYIYCTLQTTHTLECVVLYIYCTLQTTHTLECTCPQNINSSVDFRSSSTDCSCSLLLRIVHVISIGTPTTPCRNTNADERMGGEMQTRVQRAHESALRRRGKSARESRR
jgi:hypothetical protein